MKFFAKQLTGGREKEVTKVTRQSNPTRRIGVETLLLLFEPSSERKRKETNMNENKNENGVSMCRVVTDKKTGMPLNDEKPKRWENEPMDKEGQPRKVIKVGANIPAEKADAMGVVGNASKVEMAKIVDKAKGTRIVTGKSGSSATPNGQAAMNGSLPNGGAVQAVNQRGNFLAAVSHEGEATMNATVYIRQMIYNEDKRNKRYKCLVTIDGFEPEEYEIPAEQYLDGKWLRKCMGYFPPVDCKVVTNYLQQTFKQFQGVIIKETDKPGWITEGNALLYVTPQGAVGNSTYFHKSEKGQMFSLGAGGNFGNASEFLEMERLTTHNPAATIINLYTILGFTSSLFRMARLPSKFVVFLHGRSGVRKTHLALAMTQIANRGKAQYSLKSTAAGLESGFGHYKDAVMLVDDLCPATSSAESRLLEHNLELVIRCFGDGNGKMRCTDYYDRDGLRPKQFETSGGAIITGEYYTGVESSLARMILLPLAQGDVDLSLLTKVQNDDTLLARFLWGFFHYICENQVAVLELIGRNCTEYRSRYQGRYSNSRYAEYQAQLMTASDLLLYYCCKTGQTLLNGEDLGMVRSRHEAAIQVVVSANDKGLVERSLITRLCNAITIAIESRRYPVIGRYDKTPLNPREIILEDEACYYIPQPLIVGIVRDYNKMCGEDGRCNYSARAIGDILKENGLLMSTTTGGDENRSAHSNRIVGITVRHLEIKKDELRKHTAL